MTVRSEHPEVDPTPSDAVPVSRRERRAKGKQAQIPLRARHGAVVNQRQYAVRRRG
jgi:hypothetical protein